MDSQNSNDSARSLDTTAAVLIEHLEGKLKLLPYLREWHGLSDEVVEGLQQHIQEEIDYLKTISADITFQVLMDSHFDKSKAFKETVLEKRDEEKVNLEFNVQDEKE